MNSTDMKIYVALLELLSVRADITPKILSLASDVPISTIYHKIQSRYLYKNKIKIKEKKWQKKK